jgi:cytoskeletal protein CcmA (bactofilin family)
MLKKKGATNKGGFDTLIGVDSLFEGNIESEGTVRVDGKLKDDMKVKGDVFVGDSAVVTGSITADNVHVSGTVDGNIHSTGVLRILSTAKLYGDIQVKSFVTDEGALFQGKCSMMEIPESEKPIETTKSKKKSKESVKHTVLDQVYQEKEKNKELKDG